MIAPVHKTTFDQADCLLKISLTPYVQYLLGADETMVDAFTGGFLCVHVKDLEEILLGWKEKGLLS